MLRLHLKIDLNTKLILKSYQYCLMIFGAVFDKYNVFTTLSIFFAINYALFCIGNVTQHQFYALPAFFQEFHR